MSVSVEWTANGNDSRIRCTPILKRKEAVAMEFMGHSG